MEKTLKTISPRRKIIIFALVSSVALMLIIVIVNVVLLYREMSKMDPLETGAVISGVYAIKDGFVNVYLIESSGKYVTIDAGASASGVRKGLETLDISSDDVVAVLLTHTHGDHTGALNVFEKATVYGSDNTKSDSIKIKLADNETFGFAGLSVRCISTPGHSDDSVCYLVDGKFLFTGDTLSLKEDKVGLFNSQFNDSDEQQGADIEKLAKVGGVQYLFTAHYGYTNRAVFP